VIQGRGAFLRFKDGIIEHGIDKHWYKYKENKVKELVIEWCSAFIVGRKPKKLVCFGDSITARTEGQRKILMKSIKGN
jgi:hypothetical protein